MSSITVAIIIVTALISFICFSNRRLMDVLIFWPPAVSIKHQYYRFITSGFIHADMLHLLFNMITLYFFGQALELFYAGELGLQRYYYPILYVLALIISNIPSYVKHKDDYSYRSLGASGAVCAVMFACILIRPWQAIWLYGITMPALLYALLFMVFSIYMARRGGDNVNHNAHLWGALFGVLFTIAVSPGIVNHFWIEMHHPRLER